MCLLKKYSTSLFFLKFRMDAFKKKKNSFTAEKLELNLDSVPAFILSQVPDIFISLPTSLLKLPNFLDFILTSCVSCQGT